MNIIFYKNKIIVLIVLLFFNLSIANQVNMESLNLDVFYKDFYSSQDLIEDDIDQNNLKKKEINQFFWNLTKNQFDLKYPNASFIRKGIYQSINRKNSHKYYFWGVGILGLFVAKFFLYNLLKNKVEKIEKEALKKMIKESESSFQGRDVRKYFNLFINNNEEKIIMDNNLENNFELEFKNLRSKKLTTEEQENSLLSISNKIKDYIFYLPKNNKDEFFTNYISDYKNFIESNHDYYNYKYEKNKTIFFNGKKYEDEELFYRFYKEDYLKIDNNKDISTNNKIKKKKLFVLIDRQRTLSFMPNKMYSNLTINQLDSPFSKIITSIFSFFSEYPQENEKLSYMPKKDQGTYLMSVFPKTYMFSLGSILYFPSKILFNLGKAFIDFQKGKNPPIDIISPNKLTLKLDDIGGLFLVKKMFKNLIEELDYSSKSGNSGKGIVLHGGPGTGKTLSAQILAKELDYYFMYVDGISLVPSKDSQYNTAQAIQYVFKKAKELKKCVILFDEFDRFVTTQEILSEFLKLLDIYLKESNIIFIATTNRLQNFDEALLRAGRLSNVIFVDNPSVEERKDMIEKLFKNKNLIMKNKFLFDYIAKITQNISSAAIVDIFNKIVIKKSMFEFKFITKEIIDEAYFSIILANKIEGKVLPNEYMDYISTINASEIYHIIKNTKKYPYNLVFSTIQPFEKIYKDNDFYGLSLLISKSEINKNKNSDEILQEIESVIIKIVTEDIYFNKRSSYTSINKNKSRKLIEEYLNIIQNNIDKNLLETNINKIYDNIYEKMLKLSQTDEYKKYIKLIANLLKNNDIVTSKKIIDEIIIFNN